MRVSYSASRRPPEFVRGPHRVELAAPTTNARSIGSYLREARQLTEAQLEQILLHQRQLGVRFGGGRKAATTPAPVAAVPGGGPTR